MAEAGRVVRELELVHVDLESLRLVLQVQLQLGPDLLKVRKLVPSVLAFVLWKSHQLHQHRGRGGGTSGRGTAFYPTSPGSNPGMAFWGSYFLLSIYPLSSNNLTSCLS